jgi:hypothetical protein
MIMTTTFQHGLDPENSHIYYTSHDQGYNMVLRSVLKVTDLRQDILFR